MPDNAKSPSEPSMEEIIASISRIITEDNKPAETTRPASTERSDILELTDVVNEDGSVSRLKPAAREPGKISAGSEGEVNLATTQTSTSTESEPPCSQGGIQTKPEQGRERFLSSTTSGAAAAAFAQLGALPRERRKQGELPLGGADRTLEDVVRELLAPMLQTWLDQHLPGIVERLVREEISRVVGEAGLR
jgi:cell pole-organizing protein PopZ